MSSVLAKIWGLLTTIRHGIPALSTEIEEAKILAAKALAMQIAEKGVLADIRDAEFKVFSQFGEDGILEYLIRQIGIPADKQSFVEFGVESYRESNTRFLLMNRNWRGLVIDGSADHMEGVKKSALAWRHDLTAVAAFIDRDNINRLIEEGGLSGEIGLLSVDIDGNDYWVWESIDVISPIIVVAEYNSVFGPDLAITVPYDPRFVRSEAHHSHLYWGASISALATLAGRKGYDLVGGNSAGNNVFFVRRDCLGELKVVSPAQAWVESRFRESRDPQGALTFLTGSKRFGEIAHLPVVDVLTGITGALSKVSAAQRREMQDCAAGRV